MAFKRWFWNAWYRYLSRKIGTEGVHFLNYGYWPPEGKTVELDPYDEPNRPAIQLYDRVVADAAIEGANVVEVSCGHGGGASYLVRSRKPKSYVAIDRNDRAIERNRNVHAGLGIEFVVADAQNLPLENESVDVVVNVEASHCYPNFAAFAAQAYRVLRRGGTLRWADFRLTGEVSELENDFVRAGFVVEQRSDVTPSVVAALRKTSDTYRELVRRYTPKFLHKASMAFAAVEGSSIYESFASGQRAYWVFSLRKPRS